MMTVQEFWAEADGARLATEQKARAKMQHLQSAPIESLRRVLLQYRYFTIYYIRDMALLLARLPFGKLRTFIGHVLSEELGEGDHMQSHPQLYDAFLLSIGVEPGLLEDSALPENVVLLEQITNEIQHLSVGYGIGVRGMGGECLCHTYLMLLHEYLRKNPYIQAHAQQIDWRFWDIHTGPIDQAHVELARATITEMAESHQEMLPEISAGYRSSITIWDGFWSNVFKVETTRQLAGHQGPYFAPQEWVPSAQQVQGLRRQSA
jgi:Iron-containing redox enzyme